MDTTIRKKWIRTITALIVFTVLLVVYIWHTLSPDVVYTYRGDSGEKVIVYRERDIDYGDYNYYYIVCQGGRKLVGPYSLYGWKWGLDHPHFETVVDKDQPHIIGIIESTNPHIVLAVYDFDTSESFPGYTSLKTTRQQTRLMGYDLVDRLPPSRNGRPYVLGTEATADDWEHIKAKDPSDQSK